VDDVAQVRDGAVLTVRIASWLRDEEARTDTDQKRTKRPDQLAVCAASATGDLPASEAVSLTLRASGSR
jgi:hypothetical protein